MLEAIVKLIDVKTIVTLSLTAVFSYLSVIGTIQPNEFMTIFTVVVSFYFGTQYQKKITENTGGEKE